MFAGRPAGPVLSVALHYADRLIALILFLFFASRDVEGLSELRGAAEGMLFAVALIELLRGVHNGRRILRNPLFLSILVFAASAVYAGVISPFAADSFRQMRTPVFKCMILIPPAAAVCVSGLLRRGWTPARTARLLIFSFAASGIGHLLWVLFSYLGFWAGPGLTFEALSFHRFRMYAVLGALPFALTAVRHVRGIRAVCMGLAAAGLILITVTSNSRGAWLALLVAAGYLGYVNRAGLSRRFVAGALSVSVLFLVLLAFTPLAEPVAERISEGFYTSRRAGNGVWGASLDMIQQQPWRGYGYGDKVYHTRYNEMAARRPEWVVHESKGAHNVILTHWVAAGVPGLLALLLLYGGFLAGLSARLRRPGCTPAVRDLLHAAMASFLAVYLVRGQFETVRWHLFGTLTALVLWTFLLPEPDPGDS